MEAHPSFFTLPTWDIIHLGKMVLAEYESVGFHKKSGMLDAFLVNDSASLYKIGASEFIANEIASIKSMNVGQDLSFFLLVRSCLILMLRENRNSSVTNSKLLVKEMGVDPPRFGEAVSNLAGMLTYIFDKHLFKATLEESFDPSIFSYREWTIQQLTSHINTMTIIMMDPSQVLTKMEVKRLISLGEITDDQVFVTGGSLEAMRVTSSGSIFKRFTRFFKWLTWVFLSSRLPVSGIYPHGTFPSNMSKWLHHAGWVNNPLQRQPPSIYNTLQLNKEIEAKRVTFPQFIKSASFIAVSTLVGTAMVAAGFTLSIKIFTKFFPPSRKR